MKRIALIISSILFVVTGMFAQNLIDPSTWTAGSGNTPGFYINGDPSENVREMGVGPQGNSVLLWKAIPDATSGKDGGWNTGNITISDTKTYRLTVWIKKTNSTQGTTYFGLNSRNAGDLHTTLKLDGTPRPNAYFFSSDLPQLNKWYLLVAFVHKSSYTLTSNQGGVYDVTGTKVASLTDYKFASGAVKLIHRNYLYYDTNTADRQYHYAPTVYEVNGSEPSIQSLIDGGSNNTGSGAWSQSGTTIFYNQGNVGIGTGNTDAKLTVKGNIHAEEVKVDLSVPAPDYVFKDNYGLLSIEETKKYIDTHGHLPNIPAANILENDGVDLGTMNMKLLEKIEELTLYTIEQQESLKKKEVQLKTLEARIKKLEMLLTKKE